MITEHPEHRGMPTPVKESVQEDFLCIKGYLVPRELLSRQPEQAIDLRWLEACGGRH
jgi:hypothetical protein